MANGNTVELIGNITRDPELRFTPSGAAVANFGLAVNRRWRNQQTNEWIESTDWYRVTVWGDRAERTAEQFRKGNRVFVEGRFRTREYEARDGQKRVSLEITADNVISLEARVRDEEGGSFGASSGSFGGGAGGDAGAGGGGGEAVSPRRPAPRDDDLDDLPF